MPTAHATCGRNVRRMLSTISTGTRLKRLFSPIHRDGWSFIAIFATIALGLAYVATPLGVVGGLLTAWCIYFFRDPTRITPQRTGLMVSPADGVVQLIDQAAPPAELEMGTVPRPRVAIFMNVFNVHVNRIPLDGQIEKLAYRPGRFFDASLDKASEHNERQAVRLGLENGQDMAVVQIAGLIARRIRCDIKEGQAVRTGERFGLIRFGSRVDCYLPVGAHPLVAIGQCAVAGETVIADLRSDEPQRFGQAQ